VCKASGGSKPKSGRVPGALVGGGDGIESGPARKAKVQGSRLFGIVENMFYMFSTMLF
jgi:hypothetical protein